MKPQVHSLRKLWLYVGIAFLLGLLGCAKNTGYIEVSSTPEGADVYLDDTLWSLKTDCIIHGVEPGDHVIRLELLGYAPWVDTMVVEAGKVETVDAVLGAFGTLKWRYKTDGPVWSSPAIGSDGTIYFGSRDNHLYALNPDGSLKWRYNVGSFINSAPVIGADGTIYVLAFDHLYAFDPSGSLKWSYQAESRGYYSPAIGQDGTIYFGAGKLYALSPSGNIKWKFWAGGGMTPAIAEDGTIYTGLGYYFYSLNPDGSTKWYIDVIEWLSAYTSPAIDEDGTVYVATFLYYFYALNPDSSVKWKYKTAWGNPVIGEEGIIYFHTKETGIDCKDCFVAINSNGILKWKYELGDYDLHYSVKCSPCIGADGIIYFGTPDGYLCALNPNGTLAWRHHTDGAIYSCPAIAADGTIYFGSEDGYLYALYSTSQGLACTPWPKLGHDNQNTGRAQ